jgi:carboxypeptidase Taq
MQMEKLQQLKEHFAEIIRLNYIRSLLGWDQAVYMPKGGNKGRSEQMALMSQLVHKRIKSEKTNQLIKEAEKITNMTDIESALIREAKREYEHAIRIPDELIGEISKQASIGFIKWEKAREKSDFSIFKPSLGKIIELKKEFAEKLATGPDPYSTLIDLYEPGATYSWISSIFNELKPKLIKIVKKLDESNDKPSQAILKKKYDPEKQWQISIKVIKKLNFNFDVARQDKSTHPFTTSISSNDTRITTRINEEYLPACLFGTIHECGHALYQMGFMEEIHDTLLADGSSMGIHESQSRLWENIVGRSKGFWKFWFPQFQETFSNVLKDYPLEEFYRSINVVQPSLIRVEADEVSYALHIILRFELEKMIVEDSVEVDELPELWNEKMENLLGILPLNDAQGILQDVHWSGGGFGYFPSYALGNLYAAQIYNKVLSDIPNLPLDIENGRFSILLDYLKEHIYQYGKAYYARDLIKKISGEDLNPIYFINYIEKKFYPIYGI